MIDYHNYYNPNTRQTISNYKYSSESVAVPQSHISAHGNSGANNVRGNSWRNPGISESYQHTSSWGASNLGSFNSATNHCLTADEFNSYEHNFRADAMATFEAPHNHVQSSKSPSFSVEHEFIDSDSSSILAVPLGSESSFEFINATQTPEHDTAIANLNR